MRSRSRRRNRWSVSMKSRWSCMPISAHPGPCIRDELFGATASTNAVARPTRFAEWSQGGAAFHQGDERPLLARVCRLPTGCGGALPGGRYHPSGDGQSEFAHPQGSGGAVRREGGRLAVGPVQGPLHAETRKLAEPGRNRNQLVLPAVPGTAKNPIAGRSAAGSQGMGPENESRSGPHRLALYPQTGTLEVRLQKEPDYAVTAGKLTMMKN